MQTNKEFEDFFRERLNGLEETPPPNAWGKISQDIKPPRTYYREMAAAILLCLVSVCIYLGVSNQAEQTVLPEATTAGNIQKATQTPESASKQTLANGIGNSGIAGKTNTSGAAETANTNAGNIAKTDPTERSVEPVVAGSSTIINKGIISQGPVALVKIDKNKKVKTKNSESEISPEIQETAIAFNTKVSNPVALAPEKQYALGEKNYTGANNSNAEKNASVTKENNKPETALNTSVLAGTKQTDSEEKDLVKPAAETLLAQNMPIRTDSIALKTVPEALPDSLKEITQVVTYNAPEEKPEEGKFAITVNFTPGVIARRLIANPNDDTYLRFTENHKSNKAANLGFDLSAMVQHRISPHTTIDAGFAYTKLHSNVNYKKTDGELNVVSKTIAPGSQSAAVKVDYAFSEEEFQNEFTYGAIRFGVSQEVVKTAKNTLFVSGGAGMNMLLSNSGLVHSATGTGQKTASTVENNAFHTVNSHIYLSTGLAKTVMPKVSILVAPSLNYYLNSALRKQHIFELKPYTFGLNFGLRYQL